MSKGINKVIVVGAGPVGLLAALSIAQLGINVDVLESSHEIDGRPRGAAYGPSGVRVLREAGVVDKMREKGREVYNMCWRQLGGKYIAGITGASDLEYLDRFLVLPVHQVSEILYEELGKYPNAKVLWKHAFVGLNQDESKVTATMEHNNETSSISGDFLIGCDGANSGVRKALFGRNFPGRTLDVQLVATNIRYAGFEKSGWTEINWIIDPEHWAVLAPITQDDVWRVSYGELGHLNEEELRERLPAKFEALLPGNPKEGEYQLERFNPFKLQQRCAEKMRVGRIMLAGDAAHLCNPMGGLGLTGGMADVGSLVQCLRGIHQGLASIDILDKYDEKRREVYRTVTDPITMENLQRLLQEGKDALGNDAVLRAMDEASRDPVVAAALWKAPDGLTADMTQFYDLKPLL